MEIKFQEIIIGNHIILRKLELDDAQQVFIWRSGKSGEYLRQPEGYTEKSQSEWIKSRGPNEINYIISTHQCDQVANIHSKFCSKVSSDQISNLLF